MAKYKVCAVRNYYSSVDFEVEADSLEAAQDKAQQMIDDCVVEFSGIEAYDEHDEVEVWEKRKEE